MAERSGAGKRGEVSMVGVRAPDGGVVVQLVVGWEAEGAEVIMRGEGSGQSVMADGGLVVGVRSSGD